jgi:hypothetical protein
LQRLASRRAVQARQEDLIMVSNRLFSVLAAVAMCVSACASSEPVPPEPTASAESPQAIAPLVCTQLFTAPVTPLNCGATTTASLALATSAQASIAAQMQAAFANITLTPSLAASQVAITSQAAEFATFFGSQIVAPLTTGGAFTAAVPLTLGTIAPGFGLTVNVFGAIPGVITPFATGAPLLGATTPLALSTPAVAMNASLSAFNTAAFNAAALNTTAMSTGAAVNAASMPLTFLITTPLATTAPLICSGAVTLGCL